MAKKKESTISSIQESGCTKIVDQFRDGFSGRMKPISESYVIQTADNLRNYVKNNPRMLSIEKFCSAIGMHRKTFDRLADKWEILGAAREFALQEIGIKLEEGAFFADSGIREKPAMHMLPQYSQTWKEREDKLAAMHKENEGTGSFVAVIEPFPNSDKVPPRLERVDE